MTHGPAMRPPFQVAAWRGVQTEKPGRFLGMTSERAPAYFPVIST